MKMSNQVLFLFALIFLVSCNEKSSNQFSNKNLNNSPRTQLADTLISISKGDLKVYLVRKKKTQLSSIDSLLLKKYKFYTRYFSAIDFIVVKINNKVLTFPSHGGDFTDSLVIDKSGFHKIAKGVFRQHDKIFLFQREMNNRKVMHCIHIGKDQLSISTVNENIKKKRYITHHITSTHFVFMGRSKFFTVSESRPMFCGFEKNGVYVSEYEITNDSIVELGTKLDCNFDHSIFTSDVATINERLNTR